MLTIGTPAEPFIVSTFIADYEDSKSRETVVFGEKNARKLYERKVKSEVYSCVRLDRAKYNEHNGKVDYDGKLEYWVDKEAPGASWMVDDGCSNSDRPWWIDDGENEDYAFSDERYYELSGDPWDV